MTGLRKIDTVRSTLGIQLTQSFTNTQMLFESAKSGHGRSEKVDTGVNLYDETYHHATFQYSSNHVSPFFDGKLLRTITDQSIIPTVAMDLTTRASSNYWQ